VCGRGKSNDEHPCFRVAETGQGSTPIGLGRESGDLLSGDLFPPRDQSRAEATHDDLGIQLRQH
jgi:hypothetical protein